MKSAIVAIILLCVVAGASATYFMSLSTEIEETNERLAALESSEPVTARSEPVVTDAPPAAVTPATEPIPDIDKIVAKKVNDAIESAMAAQQAEIDAAIRAAVDREVEILTEAFSQTMAAETVAEEERREQEREERRERQRERMEQWRTSREKAEMERMNRELALRDDQKERVAAIVASQNEAMRTGMEKMRTGETSVPEFIQDLRKQNDDAMREVLDDEQFATYQESQQKRYGWIYNLMGVSRGGSRNSSSPTPAR